LEAAFGTVAEILTELLTPLHVNTLGDVDGGDVGDGVDCCVEGLDTEGESVTTLPHESTSSALMVD
jgi:hypothetical protein